jgi:toxin ParE1/3/4
MKLFWRRRAEQQLRAQLQFLEDVNPRAAKRMRMRIRERLTRLKRAPLTGRPSRAEGVRELIIAGTPYVAVYEVGADAITIISFFHASQNRPGA